MALVAEPHVGISPRDLEHGEVLAIERVAPFHFALCWFVTGTSPAPVPRKQGPSPACRFLGAACYGYPS